jgi:hypothetical protein
MDDAPDPRHRRYADAETSLILRRAAELQGTAPDPAGPTLSDLEQVAGEAGIEPRYVRQAAAELAPGSRGMLSAPGALRLQRVVAGEIDASDFDALLEEIRAATGMAGQASLLGRGFTWTSGAAGHPSPPRAITVSVTALDGTTVVRADESLEQVASTYVGMGLASALAGSFGGVALAGGSPSVGVIAAAVAWAGGSALAALRLHRRTAARHHRDLAAILHRIADRAESLAASAAPSASRPPLPPPA